MSIKVAAAKVTLLPCLIQLPNDAQINGMKRVTIVKMYFQARPKRLVLNQNLMTDIQFFIFKKIHEQPTIAVMMSRFTLSTFQRFKYHQSRS